MIIPFCREVNTVIDSAFHGLWKRVEKCVKIRSLLSGEISELPIIINLDVMLARRKMKLNDLPDLVGIILQNLSVLKTGRATSFTTLE